MPDKPQEIALQNGPRPINTWLESLTSQVNSASAEAPEMREAKAQKDEAILVLLAKLALVYWRPDFTPSQAKQLYAQYLDDLRDLPFKAVSQAIETYRRDPESKFYPTPGQLRGLVTKAPSWWVGGQKEWSKEIRDDGHKELAQIAASKTLALPPAKSETPTPPDQMRA